MQQEAPGRVDAESGEALGVGHRPDDRFGQALLHLVEVGDLVEPVGGHLARGHRAQRRRGAGDALQHPLRGEGAAAAGNHCRGVHRRGENVGAGESGRAGRQRPEVEILGRDAVQGGLEQQAPAFQVRRGDRQRAGQQLRGGDGVVELDHRRDPEHAGEAVSLRDRVEEPAHDGRHLGAEHALVAGNGIEAIHEQHRRDGGVPHRLLQNVEQPFRLEDELQGDLLDGSSGSCGGGRHQLRLAAPSRALQQDTGDSGQTPRRGEVPGRGQQRQPAGQGVELGVETCQESVGGRGSLTGDPSLRVVDDGLRRLGAFGGHHGGVADQSGSARVDQQDPKVVRLTVLLAVGGIHHDGVARGDRYALKGPRQMAGIEVRLPAGHHAASLGERGSGHLDHGPGRHPVLHGDRAEFQDAGTGDLPGPDQHVGPADLGGPTTRQAHGGEDRGVGASHRI